MVVVIVTGDGVVAFSFTWKYFYRPALLSPFHLEVIAEVVVAKADSAVVTFPEYAVLSFFAEHPLVRRQRDVVATFLIICAPASAPREAIRWENHT